MYSYLTVTSGDWSGRAFVLDPSSENRIGRSTDCAIQLVDPLCSRVHAVLVHDDSHWWIRDGNSRNGTYVNGRAIREAIVRERDLVRVGSTEFAFHQSSDPPSSSSEPVLSQPSVVQEARVESSEAGAVDAAELPDNERVRDLLLLYQFSMRLLGMTAADEVIRVALELLQAHVRATAVGYVELEDDRPVTRVALAADAESPAPELNRALSELVLKEGRAIWTASRRSSDGGGEGRPRAARGSDALCVPVVRRGQTLGVIHVYRDQESFQQTHFDFAISVANISAVALQRVQSEASPPPTGNTPRAATGDAVECELGADLRIEHWERRLIEAALERAAGNVPAAARLLGIGRATLYRKIEEYGIER